MGTDEADIVHDNGIRVAVEGWPRGLTTLRYMYINWRVASSIPTR